MVEHGAELAQGLERVPHREPKIEVLLHRVSRARQVLEGRERVIEITDGVAAGRSIGGLGAGLSEVADRLVPDMALEGVVRQPVDVFFEAIRVERLHHRQDPGVERALALGEARVGDFARQRVLEGVLGVRSGARLVEKLGRLEPAQALTDRLFREIGDGREDRIRHILPDDGRRLQEPALLCRKPVDAGREDLLDGSGHLDAADRHREPVGAALAGQRLRFHQGPDALLQEERVPLRPLDQPRGEGGERGVGSEQIVEELRGALRRQGIDAQLGVEALASPTMLVLRPVREQEQHMSGRQAVDEAVQQRLRLGIDPVRVLEDEEQRPPATLPEQEALDAIEGSLAPLRGSQSLPRRIQDRHVQEGEQRR